jgi:hypothetical protein
LGISDGLDIDGDAPKVRARLRFDRALDARTLVTLPWADEVRCVRDGVMEWEQWPNKGNYCPIK